jgi:hypothetical protein
MAQPMPKTPEYTSCHLAGNGLSPHHSYKPQSEISVAICRLPFCHFWALSALPSFCLNLFAYTPPQNSLAALDIGASFC